MRIVFMGTPDFAVKSLNALVDAGHEIAAVITQPDRPKGRGNKLAFSDVKTRALELNLPVYQPEKVKEESFLELLRGFAPDIMIVVAYGRILPQAVLELPPYGCLNVHGSILPEYRGAAPIQRAVFDGKTETGVTIMQMDIGMDTGDILTQARLPITQEDTSGTMFDKLAVLGGKLLVETLEQLPTLKPRKQEEAQATYAARILKEDEVIDWSKPASILSCQIRALAPAPGAYTMWNGQRLKLWKTNVLEGEDSGQQPGTVTAITAQTIQVQTGAGVLELLEVQPAGKKAMAAKAFCNGSGIVTGCRFGEGNE